MDAVTRYGPFLAFAHALSEIQQSRLFFYQVEWKEGSLPSDTATAHIIFGLWLSLPDTTAPLDQRHASQFSIASHRHLSLRYTLNNVILCRKTTTTGTNDTQNQHGNMDTRHSLINTFPIQLTPRHQSDNLSSGDHSAQGYPRGHSRD